MLTTLYQASCAHEQKAHGLQCAIVQVGTVDGRRYNGQQVDVNSDVCGPQQTIQNTFKPDFRWFRLIGHAYELLRCLDLAITTDGQTDRQNDYFTPVHVRGVINVNSIA